MTPFVSDLPLLVLHALRLTGMGNAVAISRRFGLDLDEVSEHLLDFEALGWIRYAEFAGVGGWALTDAGRVQNELQLAGELAESGASGAALDALAAFLPLNARFQAVCTDWQIRPPRVIRWQPTTTRTSDGTIASSTLWGRSAVGWNHCALPCPGISSDSMGTPTDTRPR